MIEQEVPISVGAEAIVGGPSKKQRFWQTVLRLVILGVAFHSVALGLSLLFFSRWVLHLVGWQYTGQIFWPSQAGLFLVILGTTYAFAIRIPALIWLIIGSKASAVIFLLMSVIYLQAPPVVPLLGGGDGLMGLLVAVAYRESTRLAVTKGCYHNNSCHKGA